MTEPAVSAAVQVPDSPYPGIDPYRYTDRNVFSGRLTESTTLLRLVVMYRGVLLYADSGVGKSSLVNAGLLPLAIEEGYQPHRIRVQPRKGEEIVVERLVEETGGVKRFLPSIFVDDAQSERISLSLQDFAQKLRDNAKRVHPLLIFDQFEEWVTLFEEGRTGQQFSDLRATQESIGKAIAGILQDGRLPVKVLICLREDYLAKLTPLFKLCPALPDQYLRITPLKSTQIRDVIRQPFEDHRDEYSHEIDSSLAEKIQEQFIDRSSSGEVRLTELQIVCRSLFEKNLPTPELGNFFEQQHGVQGILETYLERALDSLKPEQREPAICLLSRMVTSAGTRNVIYEGDLLNLVEKEEGIPRGLQRDTLDSLEQGTKLIRREPRRDVYYYEIASEFLVGWIQEKARAREILKQQKALELRRQADESERRAKARERRRRRVLVVLTSGLLLVGIVAIVAWRQGAIRAKEARHANSSMLAMSALPPASPDPETSLWLARQAALTTYSSDNELIPEAEVALSEALRKSQVQYRLRGTIGRLNSLIFSPSGAQLFTADGGQTIRVWNAGDGTLEQTLAGHTDSVYRLSINSKGTKLASASEDQSIRIWDLSSAKSVAMIDVPVAVWGLAFSSDGDLLAAVLSDTKTRVWDANTGKENRDFPKGQLEPIFGLTMATDWDLNKPHQILHDRTGNIIYNDVGLDTAINTRAFSPNGKYFATARNDGSVKVRDAKSGSELFESQPASKGSKKFEPSTATSQRGVRQICFSPDSLSMAVSHEDGSVEILGTGSLFDNFQSPIGVVNQLAFSPGGNRLAIANYEGSVMVRNAPQRLQGDSIWLSGALFSEDGSRIAGMTMVAEKQNAAMVWQAPLWHRSGVLVYLSRPTDAGLQTAKTRSPNAAAAVRSTTGNREAPTSQSAGNAAEERRRENHVALSRDGRRLATLSDLEGEIKVRDASSDILIGKAIPAADVFSFAFAQDGKKILTSTADATVTSWDISSGKSEAWPKNANPIPLSSIVFAADGHHLAAVDSNGGVTVFYDSGHNPVTVAADQADGILVEFSPNGSMLATVGRKRQEVKLWDVSSGQIRRRLSIGANEGTFGQVRFSPTDQDRLATTIVDTNGGGAIAIWGIASGQVLRKFTLTMIAKYVAPEFAFLKDGRHLITLGRTGIVESISFEDHELMSLANARHSESLITYAECERYRVASNQCHAAKLVKEGIDLAQSGDVSSAETRFQQARSADPSYDVAGARRLAAETLIEQGRVAARLDDLTAAITGFSSAKNVDPTLAFDATHEAQHWVAKQLIAEARTETPNAQERGVDLATSWGPVLDTYQKAFALDQSIKLPANEWNSICWFGSLLGHAQQWSQACDNAVAIDPEESNFRDSRGVARTLMGDQAGAIQDFQTVIQRPGSIRPTFVAERRKWLQALKAGRNPLTPDVLHHLLSE